MLLRGCRGSARSVIHRSAVAACAHGHRGTAVATGGVSMSAVANLPQALMIDVACRPARDIRPPLSGGSPPSATARGRRPDWQSEVVSVLAQWPVSGSQIAERIASTRPTPDSDCLCAKGGLRAVSGPSLDLRALDIVIGRPPRARPLEATERNLYANGVRRDKRRTLSIGHTPLAT
jgi:hypothetical protein